MDQIDFLRSRRPATMLERCRKKSPLLVFISQRSSGNPMDLEKRDSLIPAALKVSLTLARDLKELRQSQVYLLEVIVGIESV